MIKSIFSILMNQDSAILSYKATLGFQRRSSIVINDVFWGRINLILWISQEGDYQGLVSNKGITSKEYWLYLMILSEILKTLGLNIRKEVVIVQD